MDFYRDNKVLEYRTIHHTTSPAIPWCPRSQLASSPVPSIHTTVHATTVAIHCISVACGVASVKHDLCHAAWTNTAQINEEARHTPTESVDDLSEREKAPQIGFHRS